jgi:hypothetical protein
MSELNFKTSNEFDIIKHKRPEHENKRNDSKS